MSNDGPPRHLHPVDEPPFDPDYDRPAKDGRPPQDNDAEQAVLGAMLLSPDVIADVTHLIAADDFYRPSHEAIYAAIVDLADKGETADPVTVAAELQHRGELVKVGGAPYLHTLIERVPLAANATHYATIVRDTARLRVFATAGTKIHHLASTSNLDQLDHYLAEALQTLDDAALRFGGRTNGHLPGRLADLSWILDGKLPPQPPPVYARRTDGTALFYAGRVNGVFGDPECGKTWLAQIAIVEALQAGGTAAMVDVDHNGQDHTAGRLLLLGATINQLADPERFRYYEPEDTDELHAAIRDITARRPDVVLLDSLGEMLPMLGIKSVDNDEITAALRAVVMPPAKAGSCVIAVDHLPKSHEARSTGYAIGGTAKKRAVDGAYLRAEARTQPTPGGIGRITLRIEKDRTGELRKTSGGGYAGTFTIDSTKDRITTWSISREDSPITADGRFRPTHLMERISRFVEDNDQVSFTDIKRSVEGQDKNLRAAIRVLVEEGFLSVIKTSKTHAHHSIAMYREAEDDQVQDAD